MAWMSGTTLTVTGLDIKSVKLLSYRHNGEKERNMKLISKTTGEVIGTILANHTMTVDECIECLGGEIINDMEDPRWSDNGDNVIIDGVRYFYEDLE